jgi:hypothetical protein
MVSGSVSIDEFPNCGSCGAIIRAAARERQAVAPRRPGCRAGAIHLASGEIRPRASTKHGHHGKSHMIRSQCTCGAFTAEISLPAAQTVACHRLEAIQVLGNRSREV